MVVPADAVSVTVCALRYVPGAGETDGPGTVPGFRRMAIGLYRTRISVAVAVAQLAVESPSPYPNLAVFIEREAMRPSSRDADDA